LGGVAILFGTLLIPSFFIRVVKVKGFMSNISAAPPGPWISQPDVLRASRICCRSFSTGFSSYKKAKTKIVEEAGTGD